MERKIEIRLELVLKKHPHRNDAVYIELWHSKERETENAEPLDQAVWSLTGGIDFGGNRESAFYSLTIPETHSAFLARQAMEFFIAISKAEEGA